MRTYTRKKQEHHLIEDVHQLCRLCLEKSEEKVPIFTEGQQNIAVLALRIMICVGIEVKDLKCVPNFICCKCYEQIENYYKFRKKCEASYQRIKSHIFAVREQEAVIKKETVNEQTSKDGQDVCQLVTLQIDEETDKFEVNGADKDVQMEEIQVIEQASEDGTNLQTFLKSILSELSILVNTDQGIVVNDQGVGSFEVETGDDDVITFELVEEDEEEQNVKPEDSIPDELISIVNNVEIENAIEEEESLLVEKITVNSKTKDKKRGPWCPICGKAFGSVSAARRHARAHSGVRPYACALCPRTFTQKAVRDRHALVHQAKRPFPCSMCEKSFTQRAALATHLRRHAGGAASSQLRLHACPHCDKVFLYPSGLTRHLFAHSGRAYSCTSCGRRFSDRSSLVRHLRNKQACHNYGP